MRRLPPALAASGGRATGALRRVAFGLPAALAPLLLVALLVANSIAPAAGVDATTKSFTFNAGLTGLDDFTRSGASVGYGTAISAVTAQPRTGEQTVTSTGQSTWVVPVGVTSISVVAVGAGGGGRYSSSGGGGGAGGALAYATSIAVTPGEVLYLTVGAGGANGATNGGAGGLTAVRRTSHAGANLLVAAGGGGASSLTRGSGSTTGCVAGTTCFAGGNGGTAESATGGGGGGAGGYSAAGGAGGTFSSAGNGAAGVASTGGGGGGGGAGGSADGAGGGGGVGLLGAGANGTAGTAGGSSIGGGGGAGSGGTNGSNGTASAGGSGGAYGGGAGGADDSGTSGAGASGAIRIIYGNSAGVKRAFPSTGTEAIAAAGSDTAHGSRADLSLPARVAGDLTLISLSWNGDPGTVTAPAGFSLVSSLSQSGLITNLYAAASSASASAGSVSFTWVNERTATAHGMVAQNSYYAEINTWAADRRPGSANASSTSIAAGAAAPSGYETGAMIAWFGAVRNASSAANSITLPSGYSPIGTTQSAADTDGFAAAAGYLLPESAPSGVVTGTAGAAAANNAIALLILPRATGGYTASGGVGSTGALTTTVYSGGGSTPSMRWTSPSLTWADLNVPTGGLVTAVKFSHSSRATGTFNGTSTVGAISVDLDGAGTFANSVGGSGRTVSTADAGFFTPATPNTLTLPSGKPYDGTLRFRITDTLNTTAVTTAGSLTTVHDSIDVTAVYTPDDKAPDVTITVAESDGGVAAAVADLLLSTTSGVQNGAVTLYHDADGTAGKLRVTIDATDTPDATRSASPFTDASFSCPVIGGFSGVKSTKAAPAGTATSGFTASWYCDYTGSSSTIGTGSPLADGDVLFAVSDTANASIGGAANTQSGAKLTLVTDASGPSITAGGLSESGTGLYVSGSTVYYQATSPASNTVAGQLLFTYGMNSGTVNGVALSCSTTATATTCSFTVPEGVTTMSGVAVGGGGAGETAGTDSEGGNAGALRYVTDMQTLLGQELAPGVDTITVVVGRGGQSASAVGTASSIARNGSNFLVAAGGNVNGTANSGATAIGGAIGGGFSNTSPDATSTAATGGGGAPGYTGNGGAAVATVGGFGAGTTDAAASGAGALNNAGGGGGVGLCGPGAAGTTAGAGGSAGTCGDAAGGDVAGGLNASGSAGGLFGGGGGGTNTETITPFARQGGNGGVRLIWGTGRAYPSTNVADVTPGASAFSISYAVSDTPAGVLSVACPPAPGGFTLSESGTPSLPGSSTSYTCSYSATGSATPVSFSPANVTASDQVGNSGSSAAGWSGVQDTTGPTVTLVGVHERFNGADGDAGTIQVKDNGAGSWTLFVGSNHDTITDNGQFLPATDGFRLRYSVSDPAPGSGIRAISCPTAPLLGVATSKLIRSQSTVSGSLPAAAGSTVVIDCIYTGSGVDDNTTIVAGSYALDTANGGAAGVATDNLGHTSSVGGAISYTVDLTNPSYSSVAGYPRIEQFNSSSATWELISGADPVTNAASLYQATAGSSAIYADGSVPSSERIVAAYTLTDAGAGLDAASCPPTVTGFATVVASTSPTLAPTADGSGLVSSTTLTCIYTGNGNTIAGTLTPSDGNLLDAVSNGVDNNLTSAFSVTADTTGPSTSFGAITVSSPNSKIVREGTTILHVTPTVPATESFSVTYTISDLLGIRAVACPTLTANGGFTKNADSFSVSLPNATTANQTLTCSYTGDGTSTATLAGVAGSAVDRFGNTSAINPGWTDISDGSAPTVGAPTLTATSLAGTVKVSGSTVYVDRTTLGTSQSFTAVYALSDVATGASGFAATPTCPTAPTGFTVARSLFTNSGLTITATLPTAAGAAGSALWMRCIYTGSASVAVGATSDGTPTAGAMSDRLGNSSTIPAGFTLVSDGAGPTVTISAVTEWSGDLATGTAADAAAINVEDLGSGSWRVFLDSATIAVSDAFRVTYTISDTVAGVASASCPAAPLLGQATTSGLTLAASAPALPQGLGTPSAFDLHCLYTGNAANAPVAGSYAATTTTATDNLTNTSTIGATLDFVVEGAGPVSTPRAGYPIIEQEQGGVWTDITGVEPSSLATRASLFLAAAGGSSVATDGNVPTSERIVVVYDVSDTTGAGLESVACPNTIPGMTMATASLDPVVSATANGSGLVRDAVLTCTWTGAGTSVSAEADGAGASNLADALGNVTGSTRGFAITADTAGPAASRTISTTGSKLYWSSSTLRANSPLTASDSFTATYTVTDATGIRTLDCPTAPGGFSRTVNSASGTLPGATSSTLTCTYVGDETAVAGGALAGSSTDRFATAGSWPSTTLAVDTTAPTIASGPTLAATSPAGKILISGTNVTVAGTLAATESFRATYTTSADASGIGTFVCPTAPAGFTGSDNFVATAPGVDATVICTYTGNGTTTATTTPAAGTVVDRVSNESAFAAGFTVTSDSSGPTVTIVSIAEWGVNTKGDPAEVDVALVNVIEDGGDTASGFPTVIAKASTASASTSSFYIRFSVRDPAGGMGIAAGALSAAGCPVLPNSVGSFTGVMRPDNNDSTSVSTPAADVPAGTSTPVYCFYMGTGSVTAASTAASAMTARNFPDRIGNTTATPRIDFGTNGADTTVTLVSAQALITVDGVESAITPSTGEIYTTGASVFVHDLVPTNEQLRLSFAISDPAGLEALTCPTIAGGQLRTTAPNSNPSVASGGGDGVASGVRGAGATPTIFTCDYPGTGVSSTTTPTITAGSVTDGVSNPATTFTGFTITRDPNAPTVSAPTVVEQSFSNDSWVDGGADRLSVTGTTVYTLGTVPATQRFRVTYPIFDSTATTGSGFFATSQLVCPTAAAGFSTTKLGVYTSATLTTESTFPITGAAAANAFLACAYTGLGNLVAPTLPNGGSATDNVGRAHSFTGFSVANDTTPPTISWASPLAGTAFNTTGTATLNWTLADAGSGVAGNGVAIRQRAPLAANSCGAYEDDATQTKNAATALTSGFCYRVTFDPTVSASAVAPTDALGNVTTSNLTSSVLKVDTTAPVVTWAAPAADAFNATGAISPTWSVSDPETGVSLAAVVIRQRAPLSANVCGTYADDAIETVSGASVALTSGFCYRWTMSTALDVTLIAGAPRNAANVATSANLTSGVLKVDTEAPVFTFTTPAAASTTGTASITPAWTVTDAVTGVTTTAIVVRQRATLSSNSCGAFTYETVAASGVAFTMSSGSCYRWTADPLVTGSVEPQRAPADAAGNTTSGASLTSAIVKFDSSVPSAPVDTVTSSTITSGTGRVYQGAADGVIFIDGDSAGSFVLSAVSSDAQTAVSQITFGALSPTTGWNPNTSQSVATSEGSSASLTYTFTTAAVSTSFTITATNPAGGVSAGSTVTATIDATNPTLAISSISEPVALDSVSSAGSTVSLGAVPLGGEFWVNLSTADTDSGIDGSSLSCPAIAGFSVATSTVSAGTSYRCTYTRTADALGGSGSGAISVSDNVGRQSTAATLTYVVDGTAPTVSSGSPTVAGSGLYASGTTVFYGATTTAQSGSFQSPVGQLLFTYGMGSGTVNGVALSCSTTATATTCSFIVPAGVTTMSGVAVGGGGAGETASTDSEGGNGGDLRYVTDTQTLLGQELTPGSDTITVVVGRGGQSATAAGTASSIARNGSNFLVAAGGNVNSSANSGSTATDGVIGGGTGGRSADAANATGGGGAGGYSGNGGASEDGTWSSTYAGTGGGGAGGGDPDSYPSGGGGLTGGGGVGLCGEGASGALQGGGGSPATCGDASGGDVAAGTDGTTWASSTVSGSGGRFGGGGAGVASGTPGTGGDGGVRLIWGTGRAYPSTSTTDATFADGGSYASTYRITVVHTLADSGAGVAGASCPSTIAGFTLSSSVSPALASAPASATLTCTYSGSGTSTSSSNATPDDGSTSDAVGNSRAITGGFTGVRDLVAPFLLYSNIPNGRSTSGAPSWTGSDGDGSGIATNPTVVRQSAIPINGSCTDPAVVWAADSSNAASVTAPSGTSLTLVDGRCYRWSADPSITVDPAASLTFTHGMVSTGSATCSTTAPTTTCSWVVPAGVTSLSRAVVIGGGGGAPEVNSGNSPIHGGGGGGLAYGEAITVTPGETLTITIGQGGVSGNNTTTTSGSATTITRGGTVLLSGGGGQAGSCPVCTGANATNSGGTGGTSSGTERDGGGSGGVGGTLSGSPTQGSSTWSGGGGGAGGYSGNGGAGGSAASAVSATGSNGSGGGGGGGGSSTAGGGGGGGTGLTVAGANGSGGAGANGGDGGSGGAAGGTGNALNGGPGGLYGGGGGGSTDTAVRIGNGGDGGALISYGGSVSTAVKPVDNVGNTTADGDELLTSSTVLVDISAPMSVASISVSAVNSAEVTLAYTASDAGSGVAAVGVYVSTSAALTSPALCGDIESSAASGTISCVLPSPTDGATYYLYTRATDGVGNVENAPASADFSVVYDITPPASTLFCDPAAGATNSLSLACSVTFSEAPFEPVVSAVGQATFCVTGTAGCTYTAAANTNQTSAITTTSWTVPANVNSISLIGVSGGGSGRVSTTLGAPGGAGGGGGALGYANSVSVSPGDIVTIAIGGGGATVASDSSVVGGATIVTVTRGGVTTTVLSLTGGGAGSLSTGGVGGSVVTGTGFAGGAGGSTNGTNSGGGGGAGGYAGAGGAGGNAISNGSAGSGGAGGGGASGDANGAGSGGGVGLFGQGTSGTGGTRASRTTAGGGAGSAGLGSPNATNGAEYRDVTTSTGRFGAGGPGTKQTTLPDGSHGAVRIIWGSGRSFPSTLVTDQQTIVAGPSFGGSSIIPTIGGTSATWTSSVPTGSGAGPYTFTVSRAAPNSDGTLTVRIPAATISDDAGNDSTASETLSYTIDTVAPTTGSVTISESSAALHATGSTLYYRPAGANGEGFTVELPNAADNLAVASVAFPAVTGLGTGAVNGPASDTSAPYSSTGAAAGLYTFGSSPTASGSQTVTVADTATNSATTNFTLTADGSAPSVTWTSPAAGTSLSSSSSITLEFSTSDAGSGLDTVALQRQRAQMSIPGSCAGVAWSDDGSAADVLGDTSRSVTGLESGSCYRWTITATDRVGNETASTSGSRLLDASDPAFTNSEISVSGDAVRVGSTLFIKEGTGGSFTVTAAPTDPESGITSVTFGALTTGTGYTADLPAVDTTDPYELSVSYTGSAVSSGITITAENSVGGTTARSLSIVPDGSGPSITITDPSTFTLQSSTAISLAWSAVDAAGVASRSVQRERAAIASTGTCPAAGSESWTSSGSPTTTGSPRSDSNLDAGYCYRYVISATDTLGNASGETSAAILVDETAPATPSAEESGTNSHLAGGILFFRGGSTGSATIAATSSDAESDIARLRFAGSAPEGWSPALPIDAISSPYSASLDWTSGATGGWTLVVTARNGAGLDSSAVELAVVADGSAPTATFTTPAGGAQAGTSLELEWTESDAGSASGGSGVASRSLQRYVGTIVTPGSCVDVTDWTAEGIPSSTASPLSVTGLATGACYKWVLTLVDHVGNEESSTSSTLLVDSTAPDAPSVTVSGTGVAQAAANATVFFRPTAAATLTLAVSPESVALLDPESGIASVAFSALEAGKTTGWSPVNAGSDSSAPFGRVYTFDATAISTSLEVTVTNGAGTASTATAITLTADAEAPAANFTSPNEGATVGVTDGSYEIAWSESDGTGVVGESGSGVATRSLQRQKAAIAGAACPATGWSNDGAASLDASPRSDSGLQSGYCYRYRLTLTDEVGNAETYTSGELIVDSTAPDAPEVTASGAKVHQANTTVYFGAGSGTITLTATATDDGSGIKLVSFGAVDDETSPYEREIAFTGSTGQSTLSVTATNGADAVSNATTLSLVPDRTAPTATFSSPLLATKLGTVSLSIAWSASDGGAGLTSTTLGRETAAIETPGLCPSDEADWSTDGAPASVAASGSTIETTVEGIEDATCYRYRLVATDNVGNETVIVSPTLLVDTTAPSTPSATATGSGVYQASANATIYFRGGTSGTIAISATSEDTESGIASMSFSRPTEASATGWTATPSLPATDTVAPYTLALDWSSSAVSTELEIATANGTGTASAATRTLTISADSSAPTVTISAPTTNGYAAAGSITLVWSESDGGSGVASRSVQRYRAAIPGSALCADVTTWTTDGLPSVTGSPHTDEGLASGSCYRYGVVATDRVGNASSEAFSAATAVDSTAPDAPTLTFATTPAGAIYVAPNGTVYVGTAASGSLTLTTDAADSQSGIASYTFAALAGTTGWNPTGAETKSPAENGSAEKSYSWSAAATSATFAVRATNGAGALGSPASLTLVADAAGPVIGWTTPETGTTNPSSSALALVFSATDAGSGLAATSLQRQVAATVNGACPAANAFSNDGAPVANPASPRQVSGLSIGSCYRWILTATDHVGQESSATSGVIQIDSSYALTGIPATLDYGAGKPGDLVSVSQFEAIASAGGPYSLTIEVSDMTRTGGAVASGDLIPRSAFRFAINGVTYYAGESGVITLSKQSGSSPTNGGDSYLITPRLLIPFVSTGSYGGTATFTIDGIGQ
jgi:hypothetical protein